MFRKSRDEIREPEAEPEAEAEEGSIAADIIAQQAALKQRQDALSAANEIKRQHVEQRKERIEAEHATEAPENWVPDFTDATYPCFLVDYQANRTGDIIIKIRVPFKYRELAKPMQESYNQPLEAHFYKFTRASNERSRLEQLFANRQTSSTSLEQPRSDGESASWGVGDHPTEVND